MVGEVSFQRPDRQQEQEQQQQQQQQRLGGTATLDAPQSPKVEMEKEEGKIGEHLA